MDHLLSLCLETRLSEAVTILVIEISNKSYFHTWLSYSSSSSGLEMILSDIFLLDEVLNQKAGSPTREHIIRVQGKAIKGAFKKRKRCAASLEQTLHVKHITCSGTLFKSLMKQNSKGNGQKYVLLTSTEAANRKAVSAGINNSALRTWFQISTSYFTSNKFYW